MPNDPFADLAEPITPVTPRRSRADDLIQKHATRTGLDPEFVRRVVGQESRGNPNAKSWAGAEGLGQLMPGTAKRYGVKNPRDPDENLRGATDYLKDLTNEFKVPEKVLAAYNAGEGRVRKMGYERTRQLSNLPKGHPKRGTYQGSTGEYVDKILKGYKQGPQKADPFADLADQDDDPFANVAETPEAQAAAPVAQPTPRPVKQRPAGGRGAFYGGNRTARPQQPPAAAPLDPRAILGLGGKVTPANVDVVTPVRQAGTTARIRRERPLTPSQARQADNAEIELMRRTAEEVKQQGGSPQNQDPYAILPVNKNADHQEVMRRVGEKVQRHGSAADAMDAEARSAQAEKLRQERVGKMGIGEKLGQIPKSAIASVYGAAGTGLKGLAAVAKKIDFADEYKGKETTDLKLYQLGETIIRDSKEMLGSNPDLEQEFLYGKAPDAVGQMATFLLGGAVTKAPRLATAILGGTMTAGNAYDEVRANGGSDDDAVNAGLLAGGLLGPTELLGMHGALQALEGTAKAATVRAAMKKAMETGSRDILENAAQGIGQEFGQGVITGNERTGKELLEAGALEAIGGTASIPAALAVNLPTPKRLQHPKFGEVEVLPDQSAANRGKLKVAEVSDPSKIHYAKESELIITHPAPPPLVEGVRSAATTPSPARGERRITPFAEKFADVTEEPGMQKVREERRVAERRAEEAEVDETTGLQTPSQWAKMKDRIGDDPAREIAYLDLNELKNINDTHGHAAGDRYLAEVGKIAREESARLGITERQVARAGGDEIGIDAPKGKGQELVDAIKARVGEYQEGDIRGSIAGGVGANKSLADKAMYADKAAMKAPAKAAAKEAEAVKPYEFRADEIEQEFQRRKAEDDNLEAAILGPELARKYARLQRTANSSSDLMKADIASAEIERIEASLSERDRNRLYGIGETGPQLEELRDYRQSLGNLDPSDAQSLGRSLQYAFPKLAGAPSDPAQMTHTQQVAYATVREASRIAHENGWNTQEVSEAGVKAAAIRFSDPADAAFILDRFLKKEPPATQPKQLKAPEVATGKEVVQSATESPNKEAVANESTEIAGETITPKRPAEVAATASAPNEPSTTSARKAQLAQDRAELDLPELPSAERKSWQQSLSEAKPERAGLLAVLSMYLLFH